MTMAGAAELGGSVSLDELPSIDLIVVGTVAIALAGSRVGKGEGYAELEYATLRPLGRIDAEVPIASTVHDVQVVEAIPMEPFDLSIDIDAHPRPRHARRPPQAHRHPLDHLAPERLEAMPILKELKG